jgi:hypothetical protein
MFHEQETLLLSDILFTIGNWYPVVKCLATIMVIKHYRRALFKPMFWILQTFCKKSIPNTDEDRTTGIQLSE